MRPVPRRFQSQFQRRAEGPAIFVASHIDASPAYQPDAVLPAAIQTEHGIAVASSVLETLTHPGEQYHFPVSERAAVTVPWTKSATRWLWIPSDVDLEDRMRSAMQVRTMLTPVDVLPEFDPDVLERTAWFVLTLSDPEFVAFIAAQLSLAQEVAVVHDHLPRLVDELSLPPRLKASLGAEATAKGPLFDQRILREVVVECAAASAAGTWAPPPVDDDLAIALNALLLPQEHDLRSPSAIVTAIWLLHAAPLGIEPDDPDVFSMVSALGYQSVVDPLKWIDAAERLARLWEIPDTHPSVRTSNPKPGGLREHARESTGLTPPEIVAGIMLILAAAAGEVINGGSGVLADEQWGHGPLRGTSRELRDVVQAHLAVTFQALGDQVLAVTGDDYDGLGSLRMVGAEPLRHRPFVRFGDALVPIGFAATVHGTNSVLNEIASTAKGSPGGAIGFMLEAATIDALSTLRSRHTIITSKQIDAVVPRDRKGCDAIVVMDRRWLFVEIGMQGPNARERIGDIDQLSRRCHLYHQKLDQAEGTLEYAAAIADHVGIAPPQSVSMILVVSDPIFGTVSLLNALQAKRPDRQPRFVVSVAEIDDLVRAGQHSDVPLLVDIWQRQGQHSSLSASLARVMNIVPTPKGGMSADAWRNRLGRAGQDGEAA
jgi:hypothetical protein